MLKVLFFGIFVSFQAFAGVRENIVKCANSFHGTQYDTNPIGQYVENKAIVYDDKMDCMYFVFRCTELAKANFDETKSQELALNLRFKNKGILENETIINYNDRFSYAEDMVLSQKWGKNVTKDIGQISIIKGSRGLVEFEYVKNSDIDFSKFQNGDVIFWVKNPNKRVVEEIIGHLGFVEVDGKNVYFIHASGVKKVNAKNEGVTKILLKDYILKTKFIGVAVKRV